MANKYSDIITLRSQKAAYNIENESVEEWKSFIANDQFNDILRKVVASVRNNDTDMHKSFWIEGTYGTGKSHAGAVIKHLLCDPVDSIREYLEDEYSSAKYEILRSDVLNIREQKQLFPIMLYGSSSITHKEDLSLVLQRNISRSLTKAGIDIAVKTDFDNYIDHIVEKPKFWDDLINENAILRSVAPNREKLITLLETGDTSTLSKVREALREGKFHIRLDNANLSNWFFEVQNELASKTNYNGLLVIWDEFTNVMDSPIGTSLLVALQEIDEKVMCGENNSYFFYISHPSALNSLKAEEREKTKGRYHYMRYNMEPVSAFKIMSSKFKIVGDDAIYKEITNNFFDSHSRLLDVYSSTSTNIEETKNDLRKLFPLHPSTANLATYYAREAGSSSRSVFEFIGKNEAIRNFLDSEIQCERGNTITADYLWDYVVEEFNSNVSKFGAVTERFNSRKLQVTDKGTSYLAVFKSILLLNALNNIANNNSVTPSEENIKNLFVGTEIEADIDDILKYFDENSIIQRLPGGLFSIQFSALPAKEIEEIKHQLIFTNYKFISKVVNLSDAAKNEILKHLKQVNRPNQFLFYSVDYNEHTLLSQIENGSKQTKPYEIFLAMLFARNAAELNDLKGIADRASKEERFKNVAFIVFEVTFGDDKFERFIEFQANASCAQKHNLPDQQKVHTESSIDMIKEWMRAIRMGNFTYYLNSKSDVNASNKIVNTINSCISTTIFEKGPESLDLIQMRPSNTYWTKVSAKEVVGTVLAYSCKSDILKKIQGQAAHVNFLLQDSVDENLEWKDDCDSNHPMLLVSKYVDRLFKNTRKNESFNLADRLQDLIRPPFGLYQSYAGMAMVAFAMRKYVNQIFDNNGKPRTEQHIKDDIVELFKSWETDKQSAKLEFRFETKESRSLCNNFIKLFKLNTLKGYSDIGSLTDARWAITHEFSATVEFPLWSLKYLSQISDSALMPDDFTMLIDNILLICGESDMRNPALLNETLSGIETYRFEFANLINNTNNQFKLGFSNFLQSVQDVNYREDEFDSAFDFIKKNMEATVGLWSEDEVRNALMRWRLNQSLVNTPTPDDQSSYRPVSTNLASHSTQNKRIVLKNKMREISDTNKAVGILIRIVESADERILDLINNEL